MLRVIEIQNGFCRKPFDSEVVTRANMRSFFVDITDLDPQPDEFWTYDYDAKTFSPPCDSDDPNSRCAISAAWNDVRNQRNIFLMESDWTQMPDSALSFCEKRRWKKYRQELRDIPQLYAKDNPRYVHFPPPPDRIACPCKITAIKRFFKILFRGNKDVDQS